MSSYRRGDPKVHCAVCGFVVHRSQSRKRWDGVIVCREDWEPKHSQLQPVPKIRDGRGIKDARPEPADTYRDTTVNWEGTSHRWDFICDKWEDMDDNFVNIDPDFDGTFNTTDTLG